MVRERERGGIKREREKGKMKEREKEKVRGASVCVWEREIKEGRSV